MLLYIKTGWSIIGIYEHVGLQVAVVLSRLSCHLNCIIHIRSAVTWAFLTGATSVWEPNGFYLMTQPGATTMFWDIRLADNWYEGHDSRLHLLVIVWQWMQNHFYKLWLRFHFSEHVSVWLCTMTVLARNQYPLTRGWWTQCTMIRAWSLNHLHLLKNSSFEDISYFHSATCGNIKLQSSIAPDPVFL